MLNNYPHTLYNSVFIQYISVYSRIPKRIPAYFFDFFCKKGLTDKDKRAIILAQLKKDCDEDVCTADMSVQRACGGGMQVRQLCTLSLPSREYQRFSE